ncbi:MAG: AFG1 family ATPase [Gammaproteobacteria bacterium TMED1]|nr:MAG: AFG1 family ATPase [Gammaproteobacteria bacterium TMED1]|tara:strand:+ start:5127 stop:6212 length:1086 start_codon:yes stop_codon:yes gene_type:complete
MLEGPAKRYSQALETGEIEQDAAQQQAVRELQRVFDDLVRNRQPKRYFPQMFPRTAEKKVQGLYLWGGVGRGKTFLMDVFYESLPLKTKRRLHFHRFMRLVHKLLREYQGQADPLKQVANFLHKEARVICFDEFFVSDITDAMLLASLLKELFLRNMVLIATSNVEPRNLYEDGLQRQRFLPAIDLIYANTVVFNITGECDHRLRTLESVETCYLISGGDNEAHLKALFSKIAHNAGDVGAVLDIENRQLRTLCCSGGVVWFDFLELCDGPRSQNDYIELAKLFHTVIVSGVPRLVEDNKARRFISLVDEFYDRNVKLILSAAVPLEELYGGYLLWTIFQRTLSRLKEMQSREYLQLAHLP